MVLDNVRNSYSISRRNEIIDGFISAKLVLVLDNFTQIISGKNRTEKLYFVQLLSHVVNSIDPITNCLLCGALKH